MQSLIFTLLVFLSSPSWAWETDQFTRSPIPLADTGKETSTYIHNKIENALEQVKKNLKNLPLKINAYEESYKEHLKTKPRNTLSNRRSYKTYKRIERKLKNKIKRLNNQLEELSSIDGIAKIISDLVGRPIAKQEKLDAVFGMTTNITPYSDGDKDGLPTYFYPSKLGSVYSYAGFHRILHPQYFILSSTIKLFGIELGMDKLGHFFNEGYQYYKIYRTELKNGRTPTEAKRLAIKWGVTSEESYFGMLVSGIYSNADLAANYAGLHFYINLFESIDLNNITYPSILKTNDHIPGSYRFNKNIENTPQFLYKRFVSHHFNEVYNPSKFEYLQRVVIEKALESRCASWVEFTNPASFYVLTKDIYLWNGELYGHNSENRVLLEEICF